MTQRFVNVTLSIEECDERGVVPSVWPESHSKERLTIFITKRLELEMLKPEGVTQYALRARQHQVREMVGEERDNGQYCGLAFVADHENGFQVMKAAIADYICARLGVGSVVKMPASTPKHTSTHWKPTT